MHHIHVVFEYLAVPLVVYLSYLVIKWSVGKLDKPADDIE